MNTDYVDGEPGVTGQIQGPAVTLELGAEQMHRTMVKQFSPPLGIGLMKFVYATGARPLEGYTIKRGVGIGGFGEVYFATSDAGKEVALKRIQRNLDIELRGVTHCLNLKHPNLVAVYDIKYDDQGEAWIVMEFVSGESLKDVVDRNPNGMPIDEVDFWFSGIGAGVVYLHDHGIVHRDLKPGNIFVDEGVVKIGDYGLSKFISCSRRSGQTESVGTFHYMAPEIGKGIYGKEIDVYALGVILFEMLTGHVPFDGESSQEIIMKHLTADADLSDVPVGYRHVIERALYKDPAKRYADVATMLRDFHTARSGAMTPPVIASLQLGRSPVEPSPASAVGGEPADGICGAHLTTDEIVFGPVVETARSEPVKPVLVDSGPANREPIAAAIGAGYRSCVDWWNSGSMNTSLKVLILIGVLAVLILNSQWLLPMAMLAGLAYIVYRLIRAGTGAGDYTSRTVPVSTNRAVGAGGNRHHAAAHRSHQHQRKRQIPWQQLARESFAQKPVVQRITPWLGSLLMAAVVSAVLALLVMVLGGRSLDTSVETWAFYAWLTITTVISSWIVLGLAKTWECREGDVVLRRFVMLIVGLVVGVVAFGMADLLMVRLGGHGMTNVLDVPKEMIPSAMYASDGTPYLPAFLAYFAVLFALIRWWRQADPLRSTRFSLWATIVCLFVAMLIPWQIPWGFLMAAIVSVSIQLSAPWLPREERARLRRESMEV